MSQARLSGLAILFIDSAHAVANKEIDFDEAISKFADNKVRKIRSNFYIIKEA